MEFISNFLGNVNFETIFQLTCVALIMISGPVIIAVLAFRNGDL